MKYKFLAIVMFLVICLTGCATEDPDFTGMVEDNPLSEEEIVQYVKDFMLKQYGDEAEVKVTGKYDLTHSTYSRPGIDGGKSIFGGRYANIKKGHRYGLEIVNERMGITVSGTYRDGYALTNKKTGVSESFERSIEIDDKYSIMKNEILFEEDANKLLKSKFSKFRFYKDPSNHDHLGAGYYNLYLYITDDTSINETVAELLDMDINKYSYIAFEIRVFIFNNEKLYNSFDFDKCNNIKLAETSAGESDADKNAELSALDIRYNPEKLIEKYLNTEITYITSCDNLDHDVFTTNGLIAFSDGNKFGHDSDLTENDAENFDHYMFIYRADPQMYKNSLEAGKEIARYGRTTVYGFDVSIPC